MTGARSIAGRVVVLVTGLWSLPVAAAGQGSAEIPVVRFEAVYAGQSTAAPPYPIARLDDGEQGADLDRIRAGSLTFAQPLPVRDVLLLLFRGTPFSIVFDPAVDASFVGELADLSLRQALEAVVLPAGLDYRRQGRVLHVFPPRTETRVFEVSHLDVRRSWRRRATSGERADGGVAAELTATVDSDFYGELTAGVRALLSPGGRAHVDRQAGVVQVTDFADRVQQVGVYIETVTLRATRQVHLAARVLEVTLAGPAIDWAAVARTAGVTPGPGGGIAVSDFEALVAAIGAFGAVRTIASPRLTAMNNEPAMMRMGVGPGLTLSITSQISADGFVQMSVSPTLATEADAASAPAGGIVELDTLVRVRGGETVVIAGLLRDVTTVASAGGVAGIFGGKDRRTSRTELVLLLTPTVVSAGAAPAAGAQ